MFSHLCRARLWPRPRKKSIGSSVSSSPLPDDFEPEEKEVKVKLEPVPSKDVITDKKCAKEGDALKKDTSKVQPSHLEYYLNWLLKISETQKDLPIDHSCACSKSTDNPAYGLNSPQTKQPLCVNPEGVKPKFNPPNSVTRPPVSIATVVDAVKNSVRVQNVTNGNTVHRVSSPRMKVTPVSMRSHGKRHKRPESALSISSGKSRSAFNHWEGLSPDLKPTLSGAENRVRKRNHLPRRRSSRSQRQQHKIAIEEVVNLFGKHFNKALQKQTIVQPDEPNFQTSDMTTSKDLVAGYLYATLKNEQLIASRSKNTNDMKSEPSEKSLSNLNCRVKTDVQSRIPVIKPVVINAKTNGQVTRLDAEELLKKSSKLYPTKVSMVVMQCCRFLPSLDEKNIPAGQPERSLPMGTLVTALYKEKEWLYVRTAHGNVGYIHKGCCETIGTLPKRKSSLETQLAKPNFEKVVSSNDCVLINAKTAKVKSLLTSTDHRSAFREVKPSNVADRTRLKTLAAVTQEQKKNGIIFFNPESTSTLHKRTEKKEKPSSKELVVIKDYNGGCEGVITTSINVKKGDIVTIVKNDFDNWVYVQLDSGKMGYIPTSCTTKVGFL